MSDGAALLSTYPADKIIVTCSRCGLRKQYDKAAMLAHGERRLTDLLAEIARRGGCTRRDGHVAYGNECRAVYANIV
jgi:hypothetical protein